MRLGPDADRGRSESAMGLHHSHTGRRSPRAASSTRVDHQRRADGTRELILVKPEQRYRFTCAAGEESRLLERLRELARDPESGVDWFDVALLSHQLGAQLSERLRRTADAGPADGPPPSPHDSEHTGPTTE